MTLAGPITRKRAKSMGYSTIQTVRDDEGILLVTLCRPGRLNAFNVEMADELEALFRAVNTDDAVRAIVVNGEGRAFCAGMDLSVTGNVFGLDETLRPTMEDLAARMDDPAIERGVRDTGGRVALAIHDCLKPVIAAINGVAMGVGATMTLAMDIRLASRAARFGFVFGRLGIVPEACSTWFLPRLVGQQTALEWMLTGDVIDATTAHAAGLIRSLHDDEDALLQEAMRLARSITRLRSATAIAYTRQMMRSNAALPHPIDAHFVESLAMFYTSIGDGKEGIAAFLEKRDPGFVGKASALPVDLWRQPA
ncbi:MAG: crotonase/enoyl-CoA hydratase family protein [Rhizorhabdus sp.]